MGKNRLFALPCSSQRPQTDHTSPCPLSIVMAVGGLRFFLACVLALVSVPLAASTDPRSDAGCTFSWRALGCTPAADCRLEFKPWFGTLGPCKKRPPKAAKAEAPKKEAPKKEPAAAAPKEEPAAAAKPAKAAEPAEAAEPAKAAEPAAEKPAAEEPVIEEVEKEEV